MTTKTHPVEQVSERARVFRAGYSARKKIYGYGRSDALPEGMNPWRGGDSAPEDWDGGRVLLADGKSYCEKPKDWRASAPYRIIAYTPKSTPASHTAPDALRSELVARAALSSPSGEPAAGEARSVAGDPRNPWRGPLKPDREEGDD